MNGEIEVVFVLKNGEVLKRGRIYSFVPTDQSTSYFFNDEEHVVERSRVDIEGQVPCQTVRVRPVDPNWESTWNS